MVNKNDSQIFDGLNLDKDIISDLKIGSDESLVKEVVPTDIPTLDNILGGGLIRGSFAEIYGEYSSGKTFLCKEIIKAFQKRGFLACFIDVERTFRPKWFEASGVDLDKLIVSQPRSGERAGDIAVSLVQAGADLVVIDSLAALTATAELDKDIADSVMGRQAMLINRTLRKITAVNDDCVVIGTNQLRTNLNSGPYGNPNIRPGGKAPGFFASYVIHVKRADWHTEKIGGDQVRVGFDMGFIVEKNKNAAPWRSCKVPFRFDSGLDLNAAIADMAIEMGIITASGGGYYKYEGENVARGRDALCTWIEEHPEISEKVLKNAD